MVKVNGKAACMYTTPGGVTRRGEGVRQKGRDSQSASTIEVVRARGGTKRREGGGRDEKGFLSAGRRSWGGGARGRVER